MYELELTNACYKLLHDMFDLQPGESLAITCDTESNMDVVNGNSKSCFCSWGKIAGPENVNTKRLWKSRRY